MFSLKSYIFGNLFGHYYKVNDTNKDGAAKGTLERFIETFGEYLDENTIIDLEKVIDIVDSTTTPSQLLSHISDTLGNPPDLFLDEGIYRNILQYILSVYKIKGTEESYQLLFSMMGFNVILVQNPTVAAIYDSGLFYDDSELYDDSCPTCSTYSITFTDANLAPGQIGIIDQVTLDKLQQAIQFVEPINAVLESLVGASTPEEVIDICIDQTITMNLTSNSLYDAGIYYDDPTNPASTYDYQVTTSSVASVLDCTDEPNDCAEVGVGFDEIGNDQIVYNENFDCDGINFMTVGDDFIVR